MHAWPRTGDAATDFTYIHADYTLCYTRMGMAAHTRTGTNTHMGEARISCDTCMGARTRMGQEILPIRVSAAHTCIKAVGSGEAGEALASPVFQPNSNIYALTFF